jgi:arginyl-tRNA synthetase
MIKEIISQSINDSLKNLGIESENILLEHPADMKMGDYSTNVAMAYAKQLSTNPRELAEKIKAEIEKNQPKEIENIEVAGAGFINFYLSHEFFVSSVKDILKKKEDWGKNELSYGKKIMVEYTDPNPFKPFHIGHLMTNAIGESIARIMEYSGANTVRANYQGDVGPHVAKAIWGIINSGESLEGKNALWIGEQYAKGSDAYDTNEDSKKDIDEINKKVYSREDENINKIYDWGRKVTLDAFEEIYKILGTKFNHYFFESVMAPIGEKVVRNNVGPVFTESDPTPEQARNGAGGAIVFHGENYDPKLHTRVFITSMGIPLYETKEIGLTMTKFEKENPDLSIVITAIEQGEYMKVVAKAISLIHPDYEKRMKHITHGMMKFASGKMSSRKGNVITGESLIRDSMEVVAEKVKDRELTDEEKKHIGEVVGVSAVKYSILRSSLTGDIIYDFEKSISFEGDSGPYLQYTAVRANSILKKGEAEGICVAYKDIPNEVTTLEKVLYQFPEVVSRSYSLLEPHHIATYLTELASAFNTFYTGTIIINKSDPYANYRVALVEAFHQTMKNGLYLLGIKTPEKM